MLPSERRRPNLAGAAEAMDQFEPLPFLDRRRTGAVVCWRNGRAVRGSELLADAAAVAAALPGGRHVLNTCHDRYAFLVGFVAATLRQRVTLLTSDCSPRRIAELSAEFPGFLVSDRPQASNHAPTMVLPPLGVGRTLPADESPHLIPGDRVVVIAFTSGSTGVPTAHVKTWGMLSAATGSAARRFGFDGGETRAIVATVPPQHMYGFETTILLPLLANVSVQADRVFYPDDLRRALASVPEPRIVVTTPFQLRAMMRARLDLPPIQAVISATAPMPDTLAREAEVQFGAPVREIFGSTETGSIASRRTLDGPAWRLYDNVRLASEGDDTRVIVAAHDQPIALPDLIETIDPRRFRLVGRRADMVKLAGKRASLAALERALREIAGVEDAVFVQSGDADEAGAGRLVAYVVAPGRDPETILDDLRQRIDRTFLPRRLIMVDALPRDELGKLQREKIGQLGRRAVDAASTR